VFQLFGIKLSEPAHMLDDQGLMNRVQPSLEGCWNIQSGCVPIGKQELPIK